MSNVETPAGSERSPWSWHPELPIGTSPLFAWPPRPLRAANYVLGKGFLWSPQHMLYVGLAVLTWLYFGRNLERCAEFRLGWIAELYAFNLISVIVVAGALQLYFYTFKRQGMELRIDPQRARQKQPEVLHRQPGVGQRLLYLCQRGDHLDRLYRGLHVGPTPTISFLGLPGAAVRWGSSGSCCCSRSWCSGSQRTSTSRTGFCTGSRCSEWHTRCITETSTSGHGRGCPCTRSSICSTSAPS